jgi:DNA-directed RNA polymerase specialized sigma24 family protein
MSEVSTPDDALRRRAFAEIVEPEIEVMLRVARSITGKAADAEDLVQESLVRAFRGHRPVRRPPPAGVVAHDRAQHQLQHAPAKAPHRGR